MQPVKYNVTLVDGHVHIYDCYCLGNLFDSASRNFKLAAHRRGISAPYLSVLMLAESGGYHRFRELKTEAGPGKRAPVTAGSWNIRTLDEDCTLRATRDSGESLLLVAGRQVVTAEGLELLALATAMPFPDGLPAAAILQDVRTAGALPVFPWAAGKWLGKRGNMIDRLLEEEARDGLFLGDNGGRPAHWPQPAPFRKAAAAGVRILPGTDPLPFRGEDARVGNYGFILQGRVSEQRPAADLKTLIRDPQVRCSTFGRLASTLRFVRNQLHLRLAPPARS